MFCSTGKPPDTTPGKFNYLRLASPYFLLLLLSQVMKSHLPCGWKMVNCSLANHCFMLVNTGRGIVSGRTMSTVTYVVYLCTNVYRILSRLRKLQVPFVWDDKNANIIRSCLPYHAEDSFNITLNSFQVQRAIKLFLLFLFLQGLISNTVLQFYNDIWSQFMAYNFWRLSAFV